MGHLEVARAEDKGDPTDSNMMSNSWNAKTLPLDVLNHAGKPKRLRQLTGKPFTVSASPTLPTKVQPEGA